MRDFLFNLRKYQRVWIPRSLDGFNSWTYPGINHVGPVFAGVPREVPPPLDDENTGVADLAGPDLLQLETPGEITLVLGTARESRTEMWDFIRS